MLAWDYLLYRRSDAEIKLNRAAIESHEGTCRAGCNVYVRWNIVDIKLRRLSTSAYLPIH